MRLFLVLLPIIVCFAGARHTGRIYGGQDATTGQFPFMVAINDDLYYQYCNGVIIAPNWILTSAFCIYYRGPNAEVYVGSITNQVNGTGYRLLERVTHQDYDELTLKNNIALIRINTNLEYGDTIQAVELGGAPADNSTCTLLGWGVTETEDYPSLQYLDTRTVYLTTCQNIAVDVGSIDGYLGPEQICTHNNMGQGACYFDNGGPLICDGKLSGIYSYTIGFECGTGLPDVFTGIEAYTDWILSHVQS